MFCYEVIKAQHRIQDAIQFSRKGGGYWFPDLLVDRAAIRLLKVSYKPTKDADEVLAQFTGLCFIQFNEKNITPE